MDDPVEEITNVILHLTTTPPSVQQKTIETYFTPDAQFTHPFCRTLPLANSRFQIERIYRWYKILSPRISAQVHSVTWDRKSGIMYVGISQVFSIWAIPYHRAEVSLVTVLHLVQGPGDDEPVLDSRGIPSESLQARNAKPKWYIQSQNDLYQTDQFVKFVIPQLAWILPLWQLFATFVCVICSYVFAPITWWEENEQKDFKRLEKPPPFNDAK